MLTTRAFRHSPSCPDPTRTADWFGREGDPLRKCKACKGYGLTDEVSEPPKPRPAARFVTHCVRCDREIRRHSPRPIVPICQTCNPERNHR